MPYETLQCAACGSAVEDGALFCPHCGEAMQYRVPEVDPFVGRVVSQRYTVIQRIARGGMGEVYLARHNELSQKAAVKFLHRRFAEDEEFATRFMNEARSAAKVAHPNAVAIYDFSRLEDGTLYIVMEFCEGLSLKQMIKRDGRIPLKSALRIAMQACEVLAAAHRQNIVHRDVKPDNIMVLEAPNGRVSIKVLDFGIAKILDDEAVGGGLTQTGVTFGTPEYMSPEQAAGREIDARSDVYALGLVLYAMLAGQPPFHGKNKLALLQRHIREAPPRVDVAAGATLPTALVALIEDTLQKSPDRRPQTMDELLSRLEAVDRGDDMRGAPPAAVPAQAPASRGEWPSPASLSASHDGDRRGATSSDSGARPVRDRGGRDARGRGFELGNSAAATPERFELGGTDAATGGYELGASVRDEGSGGFALGRSDRAAAAAPQRPAAPPPAIRSGGVLSHARGANGPSDRGGFSLGADAPRAPAESFEAPSSAARDARRGRDTADRSDSAPRTAGAGGFSLGASDDYSLGTGRVSTGRAEEYSLGGSTRDPHDPRFAAPLSGPHAAVVDNRGRWGWLVAGVVAVAAAGGGIAFRAVSAGNDADGSGEGSAPAVVAPPTVAERVATIRSQLTGGDLGGAHLALASLEGEADGSGDADVAALRLELDAARGLDSDVAVALEANECDVARTKAEELRDRFSAAAAAAHEAAIAACTPPPPPSRRNRGEARAEPARSSPTSAAPARTEPDRPSPSRTEPARPEPSRTEPARTEPAPSEPARTEPARPQRPSPAAPPDEL